MKLFSYDWWVNIASSVLLVLIWRGVAWVFGHYQLAHSSEDQWFMMLVATYVAFGLPSRSTSAKLVATNDIQGDSNGT